MAWAAAAGALPSFDSGAEVEFNAEDNALIGYASNPAKLAYFESSALWLDAGGDWSWGTLSYRENGGRTTPGQPPEPGESAAEVTLNLAAGLRGRGVFRSGPTVAAFGAGFDWTRLSGGLSGFSFPEIGYWESEHFTVSVPAEHVEGVFAYDLGEWAWGVAGKYARSTASLDHKWIETGWYYVPEDEQQELSLSKVEVRGGGMYRSERTRCNAFVGGQRLRNTLDVISADWYGWGTVHDTYEVSGTRLLAGGGYAVKLWPKLGVGANVEVAVAPAIALDDDEVDYQVAEGFEYDVGVLPGLALYPDDRTTLAFDYNVRFRRLSYDDLDAQGRITDEYDLHEVLTSSQVGLERWLTDTVSFKVGWRQNAFVYPRHTMFAGACYRPSERWSFGYDYAEGVVNLSEPSAFMTVSDVVRPGAHRLTLIYSF